jgi:enoyl-CoA hydratase
MAEFVIASAPLDGVATITLNRTDKKNALSIALRDEFSDALDALSGDGDVKCVIVTGAGDTFSAGFDLKEFERIREPGFGDVLWASSDRFHRACLTFPLPMVAAVNGAALAGGFDLAVMCDIRIASETARFGHPEITFGDVVYGPLHDLVGGSVARDLCFTGRSIDAQEAQALRLVSKVVPADRLLAEAGDVAARIARAPRDVLVRTKAKALARAGVVKDRTLDL